MKIDTYPVGGKSASKLVKQSSLVLSFLFVLIVAQVSIVARKLYVFDDEDLFGRFPGLMFFDRFFVEYLAVSALILSLSCGNRLSRIFSYVLIFLYVLIFAAQMRSMLFGGEFLTELALENISHIEFFVTPGAILALFCLISIVAVYIFFMEKIANSPGRATPVKSILVILAIGLLFQQSSRWLPAGIKSQRDALLRERNIEHTSPALQLYELISGGHSRPVDNDFPFSRSEIAALRNLGFALDPNAQYPFTKARIYEGPIPFDGKALAAIDKPNVILFFTEGMSARSLEIYGSRFDGLTPNITEFSKSSMVVENYFNHTAATYRGIKGQLCSIYPALDTVEFQASGSAIEPTTYLCLQNMFKHEGYRTEFFNSHLPDASYIDEMTELLKFDKTYSGDEISATYLGSEMPMIGSALSDNQFFNGLINHLRAKEAMSQITSQPFFLALYNMGTHFNFDVAQDGEKFGDRSNNALNTIHNYDYAFGQFWKYFKNSSLAANTLIIFTADHCHYTEDSFVRAFDQPSYQKLFIDRVPLLIYDPRQKLPARYAANVATTVDLAPTVLHLLGFPNQANPFLGQSIFEESFENEKKFGVAGYDEFYFLIENSFTHSRINSLNYSSQLELITWFLEFGKAMESQNRIWK